MSTSVSNACYLKAAKRYAIAAAGCGAFAFVYAQFSHGVYSPFMTYLFAIPLVGGSALALMLHAAHAAPAPRNARQAWALGICALALASCLRGVFDIAGTSSPYLLAYVAAAIVFALVAIARYVRDRRRGGQQRIGS